MVAGHYLHALPYVGHTKRDVEKTFIYIYKDMVKKKKKRLSVNVAS